MKKIKIDWSEDLESLEEWEENLPENWGEDMGRAELYHETKDRKLEFSDWGFKTELERALYRERTLVEKTWGSKYSSHRRKLWLSIRNRLVKGQVNKLMPLLRESAGMRKYGDPADDYPFTVVRNGTFNQDLEAFRPLGRRKNWDWKDDEHFQSVRHFEITVRKEVESLSFKELVEFFFREFRL